MPVRSSRESYNAYQRELMRKKRAEARAAKGAAPAQPPPAASNRPSNAPDAVAAAIERATAKLKAAHAKEIAALRDEMSVRMMGEFVRGEQHGVQTSAILCRTITAKLERSLHEAVVAKIADRLMANGQTEPTERDVANAALGRGPKVERMKQPVFSVREIAQLRIALHPDGKPAALQKMFTEASALFNDRADLLSKAAKRGAKPSR
jgi:hypothetical protein